MIRREKRNGIGTIVFDRPPLNILTQAMLAEFRKALAAFRDDPSVSVVVLRAEGKHFSAGADVAEHLAPQYQQLIPEFLRTVQELADMPQPVVAAVRGRCLGGGFEVVQAADLVVAGDGATFGQPEIVLGVLPPAACALLPSLCGPSLAAELALTGEAIGARRAQQHGLVALVVDDESVEEEAMALAGRMAKHSGAALRLAKKLLRTGGEVARREAFQAAERLYIDELMRTRDATEGLQAFLEKREPVWNHS